MPLRLDLTGDVYGRLTVIERAAPAGSVWRCRCECGAETVTLGDSLRSGRTRSCGCLRRETTAKRGKKSKGTHSTHGHTRGGRWTPEYTSYAAMKQRCYDPNYRQFGYYGGRGVKVADEWLGPEGFMRFLGHIGPRPEPASAYSLDRIDPSGDYEPGNVRWATRAEQTRNRR